MNGEVTLTIETGRLKFELTFSRNVSFIRGASGTGKTYLCDLIEQSRSADSGVVVSLTKEVPLRVMPMNTLDDPFAMPWYEVFGRINDTIFIIDEECDCLKGKPYNLSEVIKRTSNYYVIISRDRFSDILYSVYSIYELTVQPDPEYSKLFIKNQQIFSNTSTDMNPALIITEDSGTGFDFFTKSTNAPVLTAHTKTRVSRMLKGNLQQNKQNILAIADGAAFGSEVEEVMQIIKKANTNVILYLPESFEWLLLHSLIFKNDSMIQQILEDYLNMIDYTEFFSLEQYFTKILEDACKKQNVLYSKSTQSLPTIFLTEENIKYLLSLIPNVNFPESDSSTHYFS